MINDPVLLNDWHAVTPSESVADGQVFATRLLDEDVVLWRLNGQIFAWQDLCLHRGTRLSLGQVEADCLVCPYHGWRYNGDGQCVQIPAHPDQPPPTRAQVKKYQVQEQYGLIWVSLGTPEQDVPPFPVWDDPAYRKVLCGPYHFKAAGTRAIENFLDVAHFPFVHEGYLGDPQHAEIADYEAEIGPEGVVAEGISIWQPNPNGTGQGATVTYTYRAYRPLTAYFIKAMEGPSFAAFFTVCPIEELACAGWMWLAMDYGHDIPAQEIRDFEDKVTAQDVPIVESQRPELLPLDLQTELHLRSDRTAIAYRRWLKDLGLTFGTA